MDVKATVDISEWVVTDATNEHVTVITVTSYARRWVVEWRGTVRSLDEDDMRLRLGDVARAARRLCPPRSEGLVTPSAAVMG